MKKIASFTINHDVLEKGLYISRIDGDVVTYDVRMKKPNNGDYLQNAGLHSLEHLLATYLRNTSQGNEVIYVGPMGCRTGFYVLLRDTISAEQTIKLLQDAFAFTRDFNGEIPGNSRKECGNYLEHDLKNAKEIAADMCEVLKDWTPEKMVYPK
ncbi:MAG: S-ribosylhomocysteine lyase [Elusimicrobiaceae bacterium]|nr:S-ribosylhomocysteine lyase [Elusimicrobiaceae bacterium]